MASALVPRFKVWTPSPSRRSACATGRQDGRRPPTCRQETRRRPPEAQEAGKKKTFERAPMARLPRRWSTRATPRRRVFPARTKEAPQDRGRRAVRFDRDRAACRTSPPGQQCAAPWAQAPHPADRSSPAFSAPARRPC